MIFIRKCLDFIFTREELHVLDSVIPPFRRKKVDTSAEVSSIDANKKRKNYIWFLNLFTRLRQRDTLPTEKDKFTRLSPKTAQKSTSVMKWSSQVYGVTSTAKLHSKSRFQSFRISITNGVETKFSFSNSCSGTEMTSYRRKEQADSDDETEPLTFLSGGKQIQVQVTSFTIFPSKNSYLIVFFSFYSRPNGIK